MTHESFGQYLLLKKLAEDPLGEIFRAGRLRDGNLEQVVLLRAFNGSSVDSRLLGSQLASRSGVHALLRSPNLAQGLEASVFEGIPYVVYDYISGRDLGALMRQASQRSHPVPTEHALLVAERLALGLSVASGTKYNGERILHGFLVPELVMLSNEGENRLLGFEVGPALRATPASSQLWNHFGRYLSPEAHAGQPLSPTDDVYSLGVILLELLVGHSLENLGPSSLQGAIAQVGGRGLPNLASLLERSVAPASQRIENVASWHENLNRLVLDRQSSSTPFHLAFYMHNLFRDEIEKESQEIEKERSIDFSAQSLVGPALTPVPPASEPLLHTTRPEAQSSEPLLTPLVEPAKARPPATAHSAKSSGSGKKGWIAAALLLVLLGVGGYFGWQQYSKKASPTRVTAGAEPSELTTVVASATDAERAPGDSQGGAVLGPVESARSVAEAVDSDSVDPGAADRETDRERLMAELDRLVEERTKSAAKNLRQEYDSEVQQLRDKLADAEKKKAEEELLKKQQEEAERKRQEEVARKKQEEEARLAQLASEKKKAEEAAAAKDPAQAAKPAAPPARTFTVGQLVQPGPGVMRPRLVSEIHPVYPFAAQRLRREAEVDVEVLVDENGQVLEARLRQKAGFGFDEAARSAAEKAEFASATADGVKVKMWTSIKVRFRLNG